MKMSFRENFIRLATKKFGGPYALISKGIGRGIITGILRNSLPKVNNAVEIAKLLGVSVEELFREKSLSETIKEEAEPYGGFSARENEYAEKLLKIFRTKDAGTKRAVMQTIDQLLRVPHKRRLQKGKN